MGRGDSTWQDRHPKKPSSSKKKPSSLPNGIIKDMILSAINGTTTTTTTPTIDTSVGTEGYDDTKATTAKPYDPSKNPQVGESIMNSGGTGANETYDFSKGSKAVSTSTPSTTTKRRKSSLKVNISGAGGTGRNVV
jgi:hypothetical protein